MTSDPKQLKLVDDNNEGADIKTKQKQAQQKSPKRKLCATGDHGRPREAKGDHRGRAQNLASEAKSKAESKQRLCDEYKGP